MGLCMLLTRKSLGPPAKISIYSYSELTKPSILNPADAPFDRTALNPSAAPTVAFEGASSAELPFATAVPKPTSTLSVPAVLGGSQATATMATTNTGNAASTTGSGPVASVTAAGGAPGNGLFRGRRGVLGLAVVGGLLAELA